MFRGGGLGGAGGAGPATNSVMTAATPELLAENVYQNPQVQELLNNSVAEPQRRMNRDRNYTSTQDALVVLVRSNDPQQVHQDLAAYCAANSINWEAAPPRVQSAVNFSLNNSLQDTASLQSPDNVRGLAKTTTTYPSLKENQQPALREREAVQQQSTKRLEANAAANNEVALIENVYVARNLTRQQAQNLSNALADARNKDQPTTRAAGNDNLPAEAMAPLQTGQQQSAQQGASAAQNNVLRQQQFAYWQSRSQAPGNKAGAAGELSQVKTDQLSAPQTQPTSQLSDQKQSEVGQRQQDLRAAQQYSASATPSARTESQAQNSVEAPKAQSATAPTTQPVADEPVDVLIVVQRATDANPTTQPATTQPGNSQ